MMSLGILKSGMPYRSSPPSRSSRSKTVTVMAGTGQLLGGGQPGRAGADDGDTACRFARTAAAADQSPSSNARSTMEISTCLIVTGSVFSARTQAGLARRRADPAGELRKVVGRVQPLAGRREVVRARRTRSTPGSGCPSGHPLWQNATPQSMQRAACSLTTSAGDLQVDRLPVAHPLRGGPLGRVHTRMLQEALRVVCHLPPFRRSSSGGLTVGQRTVPLGEPSVDETAPARDPSHSQWRSPGRPVRWMPAQATRRPTDAVASRTKMWSLSARVKGRVRRRHRP